VSPLLQELHWLRIPERIEFKLAVLVAACSTVVAQDHRRSRLPRCRGKGLERAAAGDHVAAIVWGIQACTENGTVPQIIPQRKLSATAALTL